MDAHESHWEEDMSFYKSNRSIFNVHKALGDLNRFWENLPCRVETDTNDYGRKLHNKDLWALLGRPKLSGVESRAEVRKDSNVHR